MPKVTAKQIAERLGISQAAVSIVLNGKEGVSEETRRLVLNTAEELGFSSPKLEAARKQHKNLCFVFYVSQLVSIAENTSFSSFVLKGAEAEASRLGYSIFVRYFHAGESFADQFESIRTNIDGIIIMGTDITDEAEAEMQDFLSKMGPVPVSVIDSERNYGVADCVVNDYFGGVCQAVEYLISQGCRSVGYLCGRQRVPVFLQRESGLRYALEKHGLQPSPVIPTEVSFDEAYQTMNRYLQESGQLPEAFFAENDVIAAAAIRAFNAHGIRIPDQISIIGFDDLPICDLTAPSLTTVHSFKEQLGEVAVRSIAARFRSEGSSESSGCVKSSVSTSLHIRESVK